MLQVTHAPQAGNVLSRREDTAELICHIVRRGREEGLRIQTLPAYDAGLTNEKKDCQQPIVILIKMIFLSPPNLILTKSRKKRRKAWDAHFLSRKGTIISRQRIHKRKADIQEDACLC
jgi:hypothetical protein